MKKVLLAFTVAVLMVGCKQSSTAPPAPAPPPAVQPTATIPGAPIPVASAAPVPATKVPLPPTPAKWKCPPDTPTAYCPIEQAFQVKFGPRIPTKSAFYRNDQQWLDFQKLLATMSEGINGLYSQHGCDPTKWGAVVKITAFGPYTGGQHELGGNNWLAESCQLQGLSSDDLGRWLLQGYYRTEQHYTCAGVVYK